MVLERLIRFTEISWNGLIRFTEISWNGLKYPGMLNYPGRLIELSQLY